MIAHPADRCADGLGGAAAGHRAAASIPSATPAGVRRRSPGAALRSLWVATRSLATAPLASGYERGRPRRGGAGRQEGRLDPLRRDVIAADVPAGIVQDQGRGLPSPAPTAAA